MGRPLKYSNDKDRRQAIKLSKTNYMLKKEWCCLFCGNHNYTLAGKWGHLATMKHQRNVASQALREDPS